MLPLQFSSLSVSMQRILMAVLAATLITLIIAAAFAAPVEAKSCTSWVNIDCCDSWWPDLQDFQQRLCSECTTSGCYYWYEFRCNTLSICDF